VVAWAGEKKGSKSASRLTGSNPSVKRISKNIAQELERKKRKKEEKKKSAVLRSIWRKELVSQKKKVARRSCEKRGGGIGCNLDALYIRFFLMPFGRTASKMHVS
jgi:hypothetical protein